MPKKRAEKGSQSGNSPASLLFRQRILIWKKLFSDQKNLRKIKRTVIGDGNSDG